MINGFSVLPIGGIPAATIIDPLSGPFLSSSYATIGYDYPTSPIISMPISGYDPLFYGGATIGYDLTPSMPLMASVSTPIMTTVDPLYATPMVAPIAAPMVPPIVEPIVEPIAPPVAVATPLASSMTFSAPVPLASSTTILPARRPSVIVRQPTVVVQDVPRTSIVAQPVGVAVPVANSLASSMVANTLATIGRNSLVARPAIVAPPLAPVAPPMAPPMVPPPAPMVPPPAPMPPVPRGRPSSRAPRSRYGPPPRAPIPRAAPRRDSGRRSSIKPYVDARRRP